MQLTREEFEEKYRNNSLKIAFIGMSNIGKTFRSKQLSKLKPFETVSVDDIIQEELGFTEMDEMSIWMGYPFRDRYQKAEKEYKEMENRISLIPPPEGKNFILDTTGSIIYIEPDSLKKLKETYLIVGFTCPDFLINEMITSFFKQLKPVIWNDMYQKKDGEDEKEALRRCYPDLLEDRTRRYHELADISISGEMARDDSISPERFWSFLKDALPHSSYYDK